MGPVQAMFRSPRIYVKRRKLMTRLCCQRGAAKQHRTICWRTTTTDNWLIRNCSIDDINKHCLKEFRNHWKCLDHNNQQLWHCRAAERPLNKCIFENLVRPESLLSYPSDVMSWRWSQKTVESENGHNADIPRKMCANKRYRNWRSSSQIHQRARFQCISARARSTPRTRYLVMGKVEEVDFYEQGLKGRLYIRRLGEQRRKHSKMIKYLETET